MTQVAVLGATGAQGGSVAKYLVKSGCSVRGITRDASKPKAKALADTEDYEMVSADLGDVVSLEKAFQGVDAVFCVSDYWSPLFSANPLSLKECAVRELQHVKNCADACKSVGVKHVLFSTLDDVRTVDTDQKMPEIDGSGYKCPHFDAKAEGFAYMQEIGLPVTGVLTSCYYENFLSFYPPKPQEGGTYTMSLPLRAEAKVPIFAAADLGGWVAKIVEDGPEKWAGKTVGLATEALSFKDCAEIMSSVTGKTINFESMPLEAYKAMAPPMMELGSMWDYFDVYEEHCCKRRDLAEAKAMWDGAISFEAWCKENKDKLLGAMTGAAA